MNKCILIILVFPIFAAIYGCKKDPPCNFVNTNEWDNAQFQQYDTVPDTFAACTHSGFEPSEAPVAGFDYLSPCFNPNNSDEICFIKRDNISNKRQLCSYNFRTKIYKVLSNNAFYYSSWSSSGWIAFTGNDFQIWKIKDNGDSLQVLTHRDYQCQAPVWNEEGNKLVYYEFSSSQYRFIIDEQGNVLDTIINVNGYFHMWKGNSFLHASGASVSETIIGTYSLDDRVSIPFFTYNNSLNPYGQDFLTDVLWGGDGNIILITTYMVLYYSPNGQLIKGKQIGGRTKMYVDGATYANGKIVASRTNRWAISQNCDIGTQTDLYMIDLEELVPRRILLPE